MNSRLRLKEKEESAWNMKKPSGICRKMRRSCKVSYLAVSMKMTRTSKGSESSMTGVGLLSSSWKPRIDKLSKALRNSTDSMSC